MKKIIPVVCLVVISLIGSAQNVGIGTASPNTKLDVSGAITLEETVPAISSNIAIIPPNVSQIQLSSTGGATGTVTLTGPSSAYAGQLLHIYNNSGYAATFTNAGSTSIPNGVAMEFIYSNAAWVPTSPASAGGTGYIQNQHTAAQSSSSFWISGDGESATSFTTPLLQSTGTANLNVTAASDLFLNTGNAVPSMHLYTNGSVLIKNVSTGTTPNPGLQIDMTNGSQAQATGLQINNFPTSGSNARIGIAVDMTNTKSSTGIALSNIGSSGMNGITIDADANGDGTGIRMGSTYTLSTGINIKGGTGILYNALNSGSGTALSIGGTTTPLNGVSAQVSGSGGYGGIFQSTSAGAGLFGLAITGAYGTPTQIPIVGTRGYAASNGSGDVTYGVYGSSEQGTGSGVNGNAANTGYGVYGLATANGGTNNGFAIGMYGTATTAGNGTRGAIGGFFSTQNGSHYLSLAASGGDVYLGSSDANRPSNFNGSVTSGMTVGSGNTNMVYIYNSNISGTSTYYGSGSSSIGIGITAPASVTGSGYTITLPAAAPSSTQPVYMTTGGALTFTGPTSGASGYWSRSSSTLSPATSGDAITTSGNISTTGSGTITSAGLLTGSAGASITGSVTVSSLSSTGNRPVYATSGGVLSISGSIPVLTRVTPFTFNGTNGTYPSGSLQTWSVPTGVTQIYVKIWGAGGGGESSAPGGGGGYVSGVLPVTAGTTIYILVGQGGGTGRSTSYGGGGAGTGSGYGSSGGGRSAIQYPSGTDLVTAGGGGGGAKDCYCYGGGGGGGLVGAQNSCGHTPGAGGTQSAGGSFNGSTGNGGSAATQYTGGNANTNVWGGGGGGGWYGGAAGGGTGDEGPGGGGSSYIASLNTNPYCYLLFNNTQGAFNNNNNSSGAASTTYLPGGSSDPDYLSGVGTGGSDAPNAGGNGYVVIYY